jgi:hypothetical protein
VPTINTVSVPSSVRKAITRKNGVRDWNWVTRHSLNEPDALDPTERSQGLWGKRRVCRTVARHSLALERFLSRDCPEDVRKLPRNQLNTVEPALHHPRKCPSDLINLQGVIRSINQFKCVNIKFPSNVTKRIMTRAASEISSCRRPRETGLRWKYIDIYSYSEINRTNPSILAFNIKSAP